MVFKNDKCFDDDENEIHYIATTDKETADKLRELDFDEISTNKGRWLFLNKS